MPEVPPPQELIDHLCRAGAMDEVTARRLHAEVLAFYDETADDFIRRRHHELQRAGMANAAIYRHLQCELANRRFVTTPRTERQIRRTIYG